MAFLDQNGNPIEWDRVRAAVFDVDGTLYHQRPVRLRMAVKLAFWFGTHPRRIRELRGISGFRKLRETEEFRVRPLEEQIAAAAEQAKIPEADRLREAIERWMFREPLKAIAAHGRTELLELIRELRAAGKRIIIYSDYAPEDKLSALGVRADAVYCPGREGVTELKPSEKSMRLILRREGLDAKDAVYLGDREEKDGVSAASVGMRYVQVK